VAIGANATARSTSGPRQTRMRAGLVVAQVALSMVLLLGAGLLMRTFVKLVRVDLGLNPRNVLFAGIAFPPREQMSPENQLQFYRAAAERVRSVPGVSAVAVTNAMPPFGGSSSPLEIPGSSVPPQSTTLVTFASEQLLETAGIALLEGRGLSALEVEKSYRVAVVNETLAKSFFGGVALGRSAHFALAGLHSWSGRPANRRGSPTPSNAIFTRSILALPSSSRRHSKHCSTEYSSPGHVSACWSWASLPAPAFCSSHWAFTVCLPTPSHSKRAKSRSAARSGAIGITWCEWCCA
jgi:hypothetical protein